MAEERYKQIAPAVVLAQHGNKKACRELYLQYDKSIYFIANAMTGDASLAMKLTAEIFEKMFASVGKLSDHMAFEPWFYALAIALCRPHIPAENSGLIDRKIEDLAADAARCVQERDKFGFEHTVMKIIEEMIVCLPGDAKVFFFYSYFAQLAMPRIAALEKITEQEARERVDAVALLLGKQTEKIKDLGVDVSAFVRDMSHSLVYITSKTFVPDAVHDAVSKAIGTDVHPFAETKRKSAEKAVADPKPMEDKPDKPAKKALLTKSDFILFVVVLLIALVVFSGVKLYRTMKNKNETTTAKPASSQTGQPVMVWNGAAASSFASGSGTKEDPYIIENGAQLAYLANLVNDGNSYYASCCYKLSRDIALNETANYGSWTQEAPEHTWLPIGYSDSSDDHAYFTGTFDGDDHTISGLYIETDSDYAGLFGIVRNGTVKNLVLKDAYVSGGNYVGGIVGYFASDTSAVSGFSYCGFSGVVKASGNNAGGIAGYCRAEGNENMPSVSSCYACGKINSAKGYAGGIIGVGEAASGSVKIMDCLNAADVFAGTKNSGGIAGELRAADGDVMALNCVNAGMITGGVSCDTLGGLSGSVSCASGAGRVNLSYCVMLDSSAVSETVTGNGGDRLVLTKLTKLTAEEMPEVSKYETFNFDEVWTMDTQNGLPYPVLQGIEFVAFTHALPEPSSENVSL